MSLAKAIRRFRGALSSPERVLSEAELREQRFRLACSEVLARCGQLLNENGKGPDLQHVLKYENPDFADSVITVSTIPRPKKSTEWNIQTFYPDGRPTATGDALVLRQFGSIVFEPGDVYLFSGEATYLPDPHDYQGFADRFGRTPLHEYDGEVVRHHGNEHEIINELGSGLHGLKLVSLRTW